MNKEQIQAVKNQIKPSDQLVIDVLHELKVKRNNRLKLVMGVMCVVLFMALVKPLAIGNPDPQEADIVGLSPISFVVGQEKDDATEMLSLVPLDSFDDWFKQKIDGIIMIRFIELDASQSEITCQSDTLKYKVTLLETVYGTIDAVEYLTHYSPGECVIENSNDLRSGGVYIVPVVVQNDELIVFGFESVLLEVDDQSLIHSHSISEGFSRYDGIHYRQLIDIIQEKWGRGSF